MARYLRKLEAEVRVVVDKPTTEDLLLDSLAQAIDEFRQIREQIKSGAAPAPAPLQETPSAPVVEPERTA